MQMIDHLQDELLFDYRREKDDILSSNNAIDERISDVCYFHSVNEILF